MNFTAKDVQTLREKTGCGMMDCKKALVATDGDMEKAIDFLREKGLASQAKKAGRIAAEGLVATYVENNVGAVVEINSETDFVAGSDGFKELTAKVAKVVAEQNPADVNALLACKTDGKTVEELVQELFLAVRENMKIRRFARMEGHIASYVHAGGKIGVLVKFDTTDEIAASDAFKVMAKDVAMQIAAANPLFLNRESVPAETVEHEKKIMTEQVVAEGKPANIAEKIVMGKMGKYYKENCLVEQVFVKDNDLTVQKYVDGVAKQLGGDIKIVAFERFEKGEGLEKRSDNFADEVASMIK